MSKMDRKDRRVRGRRRYNSVRFGWGLSLSSIFEVPEYCMDVGQASAFRFNNLDSPFWCRYQNKADSILLSRTLRISLFGLVCILTKGKCEICSWRLERTETDLVRSYSPPHLLHHSSLAHPFQGMLQHQNKDSVSCNT